MAQRVKNLPAMQETQETRVQSLDREEPLKKRLTAHPSIPAWEIPWTEGPELQSLGSQSLTQLSNEAHILGKANGIVRSVISHPAPFIS